MNEFIKEVIEWKDPVLVYFWADWCAPCKVVSKYIDNINNIKVYKVNIAENPEVANEYFIMTIPAIMLFKEKYIMEMRVGFQTKEQIEKLIHKYI